MTVSSCSVLSLAARASGVRDRYVRRRRRSGAVRARRPLCLPTGRWLSRRAARRARVLFKSRGKLTDFSFMAIARSIVACLRGAAFSFVAIKPWSLCSAIMNRDIVED